MSAVISENNLRKRAREFARETLIPMTNVMDPGAFSAYLVESALMGKVPLWIQDWINANYVIKVSMDEFFRAAVVEFVRILAE